MDGSTELTLILNHAVDIGIYRLPVACLYLCKKSREDLVDVFLVFLAHFLRQGFGSRIPDDGTVSLLMRKDTECLPPIIVEHIGRKELFDAKTVILL